MAAKWLPANTPLRTMESRAVGSFATEFGDVLVVEVFDHPGIRYNKRLRAWTGPWCVGTPTDVIDELERLGHTDYDVVVRAFNPRTRTEIRAIVKELALN